MLLGVKELINIRNNGNLRYTFILLFFLHVCVDHHVYLHLIKMLSEIQTKYIIIYLPRHSLAHTPLSRHIWSAILSCRLCLQQFAPTGSQRVAGSDDGMQSAQT